jgi:hypothetical protein
VTAFFSKWSGDTVTAGDSIGHLATTQNENEYESSIGNEVTCCHRSAKSLILLDWAMSPLLEPAV